MRAMNLADALVAQGHDVVIWSSAFCHQTKDHRATEFQSVRVMPQLTINLLPSRGYKEHIGLERLVDHASLAFSLFTQLKRYTGSRPDIAFVGFPPIETAAVMVSWLQKRGIPAILDVKDLWPWIFAEALPRVLRPIAPALLTPYIRMARRTIGAATAISSITDAFLTEVLICGRRDRTARDRVFPLVPGPASSDAEPSVNSVDWWTSQGVDIATSKQRLSFVGALSRAYDFSGLSEATRRLSVEGIEFELIICGGGQELGSVKRQFDGTRNVKFFGWVDLPQLHFLMQSSIATVAPYRSTRDFRMSIPNKIIDSFSFGLPVLTSLDGETRSILEGNDAGLYCDPAPEAWYTAMRRLLTDPELQRKMALNATSLFKRTFSYERVYGGFVKYLELSASEYHRH